MSLFDQRYYALTKAYMSQVGIWPRQSKYVRIILPLTVFAISSTIAGPMAVRLYDAWRDISVIGQNIIPMLVMISNFFSVFICIQRDEEMELSLKYIEKHWEMLKNTPAVIVLEEYAEKGYYITIVYSIYLYAAVIICFCICLSPMILDIVDPVNETRPHIYTVQAEYAFDADKYYWFILAHTYIVVVIEISIMVALGAIYILWSVHACALFEAVGFNLKLIASENAMALRSDWDYKKICDCIILHTEAISFADLFDDNSSAAIGVVLCVCVINSVISGIQALINRKNPDLLIQQVTLISCEILHLYVGSIPGQELINHSGKIHTTGYNLNWQDMPLNAQRLLIPILIRSSKPCYLTAAKIHLMSMESFSSIIRIVLSYFIIFAQMI